jgi:hypothetical protein
LAAQQGHSGDGGSKEGITTGQNKRHSAAPDAQTVRLTKFSILTLDIINVMRYY